MDTQNQIKRTLSAPKAIEIIRELLAKESHDCRSGVADAVCRHFGFYDARGRVQRSGCLVALRDLERAKHFVLPAASARGNRRFQQGEGSRPHPVRRLDAPVPDPQDVPEQAGDVRGLQLIKVTTDHHMRIWNELMLREHPQKAGPLVGAQMRYLIDSEHGWLGGLGFAAAAVALADRDHWIGWDAQARGRQLHRIIGMNRFLIRPTVRCRNLASHVLENVLRCIGPDFEQQYHYQPWLIESFVDSDHFAGTSYQAANWIHIGHTQGRGRQDRHHDHAKSIKAIYVYPLQADFRQRLGGKAPTPVPALEPAEGLDGDGWAQQEFGRAKLGDKRLTDRLVYCAQAMASGPDKTFAGVAQGAWPAAKGYYRLIDHPDSSQVNVPAILATHRERTVQRMMAQATVLCIQDGTDLSYKGLTQCEGLGVVGANQTSSKTPGLHLHSTFVVSTEGIPLGLLKAQFTAPGVPAEPAAASGHDPGAAHGQPPAGEDGAASSADTALAGAGDAALMATPSAGTPSAGKKSAKKRSAAATPIEDKKSFAWITGLRDCVALSKTLPDTRQVCVMDREADFFELFDEPRQTGKVELLVRAQHDRVRREDGQTHRLFDQVRQSALQGEFVIVVPRHSARPKKGRKGASGATEQRLATVELRYLPVTLFPPSNLKGRQPITLQMVHVREPSAPAGVEPVEWFLLTTCAITSFEEAQACLKWYCLRWRIEDWHRVLKSGCNIEELAHQTAQRIERASAIKLVIAWRIMLMTLLGRSCPELPASVLFSDIEITVLNAFAEQRKIKSSGNLGDTVRLVARLGGYLARNSDPPPGHQLMWQGYSTLEILCLGYSLRRIDSS